MPTPYTVVLTGGIASGKTTVSDHFARLGVPVIDTDIIAREVVAPGRPALREIAEAFGEDFLESGGGLDRRKMRQAIFSEPSLKTRLESIVHPRIAAEVRRRVEAVTAPYCLLVIPLFTESAAYDWVDRVLVVDSDEKRQVERVMARDGIDRRQAEAILAAQASREDRLNLADDVISNDGGIDALLAQVEVLHQDYLERAAR